MIATKNILNFLVSMQFMLSVHACNFAYNAYKNKFRREHTNDKNSIVSNIRRFFTLNDLLIAVSVVSVIYLKKRGEDNIFFLCFTALPSLVALVMNMKQEEKREKGDLTKLRSERDDLAKLRSELDDFAELVFDELMRSTESDESKIEDLKQCLTSIEFILIKNKPCIQFYNNDIGLKVGETMVNRMIYEEIDYDKQTINNAHEVAKTVASYLLKNNKLYYMLQDDDFLTI